MDETNTIDDYIAKPTQVQKNRLKKLADRIRRTNASFLKATAAEKRVQIAYDVLAQIEAKRIIPQSTYFTNAPIESAVRGLKNMELQEVFSKMPNCRVCGIGACFVTAVDRLDDLETDEVVLDSRDAQTEYLRRKKVFTGQQLDIIEDCFERDKKTGPTARMRRIMKRIIETKGRITEKLFTDLLTKGEKYQ